MNIDNLLQISDLYNMLRYCKLKENIWAELIESRPSLLTLATEMKMDRLMEFSYEYAYPELKIPTELQSEIEERFCSLIQTYSNADCFDVPYEDMTDIFITTVATVCRHNNYDTSKIQYIVKELRDHTSIHEGFLTVVESSIRAIIAYEHLKNELICDGYTSEQAENLLPSVDALGRQFQIDEINGSNDI